MIAELSTPEQNDGSSPRIHSPIASKCFLLYLDNENPLFYIGGKSRWQEKRSDTLKKVFSPFFFLHRANQKGLEKSDLQFLRPLVW